MARLRVAGATRMPISSLTRARPKAHRNVTRAVGTLAIATAFTLAGCGGGGGGHNDNQGGPPTATPVATTTPNGGGAATVTLTVTATAALEGFRASVAYPTAKGSFRGSGDGVACSTGASGTFVKNDRDDGGLVVALAQATALTFPVTITCTFDVTAGQSLRTGDVSASVFSVTAGEQRGNAASAAISVAVQ